MKTEDILRYERMYREMQTALGTPWLEFAHQGIGENLGSHPVPNGHYQRMREKGLETGLHGPNKRGRSL